VQHTLYYDETCTSSNNDTERVNKPWLWLARSTRICLPLIICNNTFQFSTSH